MFLHQVSPLHMPRGTLMFNPDLLVIPELEMGTEGCPRGLAYPGASQSQSQAILWEYTTMCAFLIQVVNRQQTHVRVPSTRIVAKGNGGKLRSLLLNGSQTKAGKALEKEGHGCFGSVM